MNVPDLLTVDELADYLHIGRRQAYAAVGRGEVPSIRIGRTIRIPKHALQEWMDRQCSAAAATDPHDETLATDIARVPEAFSTAAKQGVDCGPQ